MQHIYSAERAFSALKTGAGIVAWGNEDDQATTVLEPLEQLRKDGSVLSIARPHSTAAEEQPRCAIYDEGDQHCAGPRPWPLSSGVCRPPPRALAPPSAPLPAHPSSAASYLAAARPLAKSCHTQRLSKTAGSPGGCRAPPSRAPRCTAPGWPRCPGCGKLQ